MIDGLVNVRPIFQVFLKGFVVYNVTAWNFKLILKAHFVMVKMNELAGQIMYRVQILITFICVCV